jgi:hypothetical protein
MSASTAMEAHSHHVADIGACWSHLKSDMEFMVLNSSINGIANAP